MPRHFHSAAALGLLFTLPLAPDVSAGVAEDLAMRCDAATNMSADICLCLGETAETDLTEAQQRLVLAQLEGDDAAVDALRSDMPVSKVMAASMFMVNGPADCAAN